MTRFLGCVLVPEIFILNDIRCVLLIWTVKTRSNYVICDRGGDCNEKEASAGEISCEAPPAS